MFTLFHFGFEIFKIAIQAAIYSSVIFILKLLLTEIIKSNRLGLIKFRQVYFSMAGLLFIFSFTYYGDHGLGDEANIPLGHGKVMNSSDGYAFFFLNPAEQTRVDSFLVRGDNLCVASRDTYYIYQLSTGKAEKYSSKNNYEAYASTHKLPLTYELKNFQQQYAEYWNGWRFWLLP